MVPTICVLCNHHALIRVGYDGSVLLVRSGGDRIVQKSGHKPLCKKAESLSQHKYPEVLDCCNEILKDEPKNLDVKRHKGYSLAKLGRNEEALKCFDEILEQEPRNFDVLFFKAETLNSLHRNQESLEFYDKTLEIDNNDSDSLTGKASILNKIGKQAGQDSG